MLHIKEQLKGKYELSDMGALTHVLGMRVRRTAEGHIHLDQQVHVRDKLSQFGMRRRRRRRDCA